MTIDNELCNMALSQLGGSLQIGDIESEQTKEARALRLWYPTAIKQLFRDFEWPKATKFKALAELELDRDDWGFKFRVPTESVAFRGVFPEGTTRKPTTPEERYEYELVTEESGEAVYCDIDDAVGCYSVVLEDPKKWDPDMRIAGAMLLAGLAAVPITGGDSAKLGERAMKMYVAWRTNAKGNALNESQKAPSLQSSLLNARR